MFPWQAWFFKTLLLGGLAVALLWSFAALRVVSVPILLGFFIAYALHPVVKRLRRWHVPGFFALSVPVVLLIALLVIFFVVVVPTITTELLAASQKAPARLYNLMLRVDPWLQSHFGRSLTSLVPYNDLSGVAQSLVQQLIGPAQSWLGVVLSSARNLLRLLGAGLLTLVVAFFLLDDFERVTAQLAILVPPRLRGDVRRVLGRIHEALGGFLRGQLLLLSLAAVAFTGGLLFLGVPYAWVLGPMAAIIYLVPYLGVLTGGLVCALLAGLASHGLWQPLLVLLLFGGFYAFDLVFVTPRLIGHRVGLPPLAVLLGIIAFGEVLGVVGVLLAIPVLACGRILLLEALEQYRHSWAYSPPDQAPLAHSGDDHAD